MSELEIWGNAAAVPLIIAITQFLKTHFEFHRKADVISLFVSLVVCFGWDFYHAPNAELKAMWAAGFIPMSKYFMKLTVVSFATWLSASKSYDFFVGDRKRARELDLHIQEKEQLKKQLEVLGNEKTEPNTKSPDMDEKLRQILEGG